ncbi:hypothetical protein O6H91_05G015900 [Diphasiastrum complanatum]|uniref:Uncharacterized protein n=2 Tax=Diphasiastrum complanatum TaxID=34168 RepID=A0ACC2DL70_DIPCM|nr:hypothetical protein O6H91_05G015900 [Diphasiastrum complanatum]KAJ7554935.1 hypothetical protein O6H91_05G015900 [Diphasiastrum complanatum]
MEEALCFFPLQIFICSAAETTSTTTTTARSRRRIKICCESFLGNSHGGFCRNFQFPARSSHRLCAKKILERESLDSLARSARPLPIRLVSVGKSRSPGVQSVAQYHIEKIRRYCSFEEMQVRPNPKGTSDVSAQVEAEGDYVMRNISSNDWVILLDERGEDVTSDKFASMIAKAGDMGCARLVFCIGGPYGHGTLVQQRADASIRLSSMVLNHQVALIVLLEQIYR